MIEKLQKISDKVFKSEDGEMVTLPGQNIPEPVFNTINELVDAVNDLQEMCKSCDNHIGILAKQIAKLQHDYSEKMNCHENMQDKFTEQRNWIGKLCKFWDDDPNDYVFDKLKEITFVGSYIKESGFVYEHCEPVEPDDDIIYKGE